MTAQRADQLRGLGQWAEAKNAYEEHLARHPDDLDAQFGHAAVVMVLGDEARAIDELTRMLNAT